MPNDQHDDAPGTETGTGRLPEPTRASERTAERLQQPALSDEDIERRQNALGTHRKPAGPPLGEGIGGGAAAREQVEDVPETDVVPAREYDPEKPPEPDDENRLEPLESSE